MAETTKIDFRYRRMTEIGDITDLVGILFPGNRNQQYAAARILMALKAAKRTTLTLARLERQHSISRRTLQRVRAKLARLGIIEYASPLNSRHGGQAGWVLSSRMGTALRQLADRIDDWRRDTRQERREKDERLAAILR